MKKGGERREGRGAKGSEERTEDRSLGGGRRGGHGVGDMDPQTFIMPMLP